MIGMQLLRELIESVILTGRVKNVEPVSLLLIAAPESGKTSVVLSKHCKLIQAFSDITGRGIHQVIKENKELTHIVINDLVAVLSHKATVNRYTLSQLNAITEEGVTSIASPSGIEIFSAGKRGVITSLTSDLVKDERYWWNKIGFASRMLPFYYEYPKDLIIRIKDDIDHQQTNGHKPERTQKFSTPNAKISVLYPEKFLKEVRERADVRAMLMNEQGMRRLKQYHALAQAHALWRNRTKPKVADEEVDFIKKVDRYVSYQKSEPLI